MRIYCDYASTTPIAREVTGAMRPYFRESFGNPSSLHMRGQEALSAVDRSREGIARSIGAEFREIIFTGSATEANNLALRGALKGFRVLGPGPRGKNPLNPNGYTLHPRIIVSAIEHESILETARDLEREGVEVVHLPVDRDGIVDLGRLKESLNDRTVLVSVMYANNEVGTIEPITKISEIIRNFREQRARGKEQRDDHTPFAISPWPLFHTDAAQAFQFLDSRPSALGVDAMTISAHKIYGPKGVGALYVRRQSAKRKALNVGQERFAISDLPFAPIVTGGGQEFGIRAGTENVPLLAGFGKAVEIAVKNREAEATRIGTLRDEFESMLNTRAGTGKIGWNHSRLPRLPHISNVFFPDHTAEALLAKLDRAGVEASSGSACASRAMKPSHVLSAMGYERTRALQSVRFSFGRPTSRVEIERAIRILIKVLK